MRALYIYFRTFFTLLLLVDVCVYDVLSRLIYTTSMKPDKVYLETTEGDFKRRFYNHKIFSTTVLIVMTQQCPNTFETSEKTQF